MWLKEGDNGNTSIIIADAAIPGKLYTAGTISGPVSNLKLYHIKSGMVAMAVAGQANPDGSLRNPKDASKSYTTARVYDGNFVRHWDSFVEKERNSIFTALLQRSPSHVTDRQGRYNLLGFTNALKGSGLECPIPPFGGNDHFDIGPKGLVIVAKDPHLDPSTHTKCNAYFIPREDLMDMTVAEPRKVVAQGFEGAATCPVFSPDGNSFAYLHMKKDIYESDKNHIVVVHDLSEGLGAVSINDTMGNGFNFDRSPTAILWSHDASAIYLAAEDTGAACLFELQLDPNSEPNPRKLTDRGSVQDFAFISAISNNLLVSSSTLVDSSLYYILAPDGSSAPTTISSATDTGNYFGLSPKQVCSLWWKGDKDHPIHAWMILPSTFDASRKYPLAYLVHGGPQGSWGDEWSTRWNPALYAEQGYVTICPDPTGSLGYGQDFVDAITENWGGSPYIDLVKGFEYIEANLPYVDTDRAVALGASYGGYMMNWFQGHPIGKKFKALVCHDGFFNMRAQMATDELYFFNHDLGGPLWEKKKVWEKWDPSQYAQNWTTPMLVIHNDLDFRLPITEGLTMFNVLQMRGIKSRFLTFSDENHWVLKYENSLVWHLVVFNWINEHVGLPRVVDSQGRDGNEFVRQGAHKA